MSAFITKVLEKERGATVASFNFIASELENAGFKVRPFPALQTLIVWAQDRQVSDMELLAFASELMVPVKILGRSQDGEGLIIMALPE